jgi:hypothetical protein
MPKLGKLPDPEPCRVAVMNAAEHVETIRAVLVVALLAAAAGKPPLLGSLLGAAVWLVFRKPLAVVHGLGAVSVVWFVAAHPWLTLAGAAVAAGAVVLAVAARRADRPLAPAVAW